MWIAFALAIAIHEIILLAFPHAGPSEQKDDVQVAQTLRISILHRVKPTPPPTPSPTPKPVIVIAQPNPVIAKATPAPAAPKSRAGLAKSIARTKYHATRKVQHVAVAPKHAQGPGLGQNGTGRGMIGLRGNGTGTGGEGSGTGSGGNGTGAGGGDIPCGFVEFIDIHGSGFDKSTGGFYVDILMRVHYKSGTTQEYRLDYPFYYPSEAANPWSDQNIKNPDFPTLFQFPPADKRAGEPDIVQYVMQHTRADGTTTLEDCPGM